MFKGDRDFSREEGVLTEVVSRHIMASNDSDLKTKSLRLCMKAQLVVQEGMVDMDPLLEEMEDLVVLEVTTLLKVDKEERVVQVEIAMNMAEQVVMAVLVAWVLLVDEVDGVAMEAEVERAEGEEGEAEVGVVDVVDDAKAEMDRLESKALVSSQSKPGMYMSDAYLIDKCQDSRRPLTFGYHCHLVSATPIVLPDLPAYKPINQRNVAAPPDLPNVA
ncbi:hypothetical protein BG003_010431 [Podila horticola]|nr:hypothetical protein BG003_010431 [Podila horticola]